MGNNIHNGYDPNGPRNLNTMQQKKKPVNQKWWFWAIIVFAALCIISSLGNLNEPAKTSQTKPTAAISNENTNKREVTSDTSSSSSISSSSDAQSSQDKQSSSTSVSTPQTNTQPAAQPSQDTQASQGSSDNQTITVYVTNTGKKYHRAGCRYLSKSQKAISLKDAKDEGYEPCSVCNPPQ